MKIGVLTAMSSEHDRIVSLMEQVSEETHGSFKYTKGVLGGNTLILQQCGIGKVNAALGSAALINAYSPDCVISTGVAGGIDKSLNVMDVVVSQNVVYHDVWCGEGNEYGQVQGLPAQYEGAKALCEVALKLNEKQNTKIHAGLICTGDQFITARKELDVIKSHFPKGLAVDMESAAIAQTCYIYNVPFVSFRIISDTPGNTEDHATQYADFWGEMATRSFEVTRQFLASVNADLYKK